MTIAYGWRRTPVHFDLKVNASTRPLFTAHPPRFQWTTCESLETVPGSHWPATPQHWRYPLEVKPNLCRHRTRCHVVRSGEGGQEVVERNLVGDVDGCDLKAPLVFLTAE